MDHPRINLDWKVGKMHCLQSVPEDLYAAKVPGAVQEDYMRGKGLAHFSIGTNVDEYQSLEDDFWYYRASFAKPDLGDRENLVFHSKGIDYEFEIRLNGVCLLHQEGMFTPVRLVLNDTLQDLNTLEVIIYPAPKAPGEPFGRRQAILAVKPPVTYLWDWHPRLITLGIWDETFLQIENAGKVLGTNFDYTLAQDLSEAEIAFSMEFTREAFGARYEWRLLDVQGETVILFEDEVVETQQLVEVQLLHPELWWTYDHGTPYLYEWRIVLKSKQGEIIDEQGGKVGFRKVELVVNDGAWEEASIFPKSQCPPPFTLRLNGRIVYAKGSNWVHPEVFYGTITRERYEEQLLLVRELNMNILRIWGGGITNKECFHELCDELGIMVWQEFPLACNPYPDDPQYLGVLERESRSIIMRVRQHPSLVMWSGGNELFNDWSGMTEQSHALRLLNSLCYQLDRHTPYIHTSPIFGVGHGHYLFFDWDEREDVFQTMGRARNTAYTEFGMPSLSPVEVLEKIIPEEELFPVEPTPSWVVHGGFEAWKSGSWAELETIEKYFGKAKNLEELVDQSQSLQCIGYKAIFEEGRRQQPYASMVLNWCLNEPWPTAANNSLIAYPNLRKPSFYAVRASLRPVLASAKFARFDYKAGETMDCELWMLNDSYSEVELGRLDAFITMDETEYKMGAWEFEKLDVSKNRRGPTVHFEIPKAASTQLALVSLKVEGRSSLDSEYRVFIRALEQQEVDVNRLNF